MPKTTIVYSVDSIMCTFVKRDSFRTQKMALLVLNDPSIQSRHGGKGSSDNDKDDDD